MSLFFESALELDIQTAFDHFRELLTRLGHITATPALVEKLLIEYQGYVLPLVQVATIRLADPRSLLVEPWDKGTLKAIEKAVIAADLGLLVSVEAQALRLTLPSVTAEDKERIIKNIEKEKENVRTVIRGLRDGVWKEIQRRAQAKEISEDDKFNLKDKLEHIIDQAHKEVEELTSKKITHLRAA